MPEENTPEATQAADPATTEVTTPLADPAALQDDTDPKSYDAEYVNGLKQEAVDNRQKAKALATRLHAELVRATGRLADPNDLPFDTAHLESADALNAAIDDLLSRKPHFATRVPQGHVGQGVKDQVPPLSLVSHLKNLV